MLSLKTRSDIFFKKELEEIVKFRISKLQGKI